jgi:hypothetical protein
MFTVTIGSTECFDQDTWEVDPFSRWIDDPEGTWVEECNFHDSIILLNNFSINHSSDHRSTVDFQVYDATSILDFVEGSVVTIRDEDYDIIFAGVIASGGGVKVQRLEGPIDCRIHTITAIDWTWLLDKRLVYLAVSNQLAGDIVKLIISTILIDEGVTIGQVDDGDLVKEFRAGYCTATDALNSLSEYSGFIWFIDQEKKLYFVPQSTYTCDYDISEFIPTKTATPFLAALTKGNNSYRNRQFLIGGKGTTNLITEEQKGDGSNRTFKVGRQLASQPIIAVNGIGKTVGIGQVDPDGSHDFYWNEGSDTITQDNTGTILELTDTWHIEYYGLYDVINAASDFEEITIRALLDGTSGIVESVLTGTMVTTQAAAIDACEAKLARYSRDAEKIEFETVEEIGKYLAAGTILPDASQPTKEYLITDLSITTDGGVLSYHVTACDGPADTAWENYYVDRDLAARTGIIELGTINEANVLVYLGLMNTWYLTDYPNPFAYSEVDSVLPGEPLIPGFAVVDRWLYVAIYRDGIEIFRKSVLSVENETDRDFVTCFIAASEAVGNISHLGLWGGEQCSSIPGSGIELDKQEYVRNKTGLETLQITFTEIKGWT